MKNILILCTGNSCRSQIAHGYFAQLTDPARVNVYSAGVETHGLNPRAVSIMAEDGINIAHHTSNHVDEYADIRFDYILTVCDSANERCPIFPSTAEKTHHNFSDPAKATGTEADIMSQFRSVRDQIKTYVRDFLVQRDLLKSGF